MKDAKRALLLRVILIKTLKHVGDAVFHALVFRVLRISHLNYFIDTNEMKTKTFILNESEFEQQRQNLHKMKKNM